MAKRVIIIVISILLVLYIVLVNVLVSAALVPDFMRKLDSFQRITDKGYAEQVHTDDIKENRKEALTEMEKWLRAAKMDKIQTTSYDGYRLIAARFPAEKESHDWVILLHGYTGWKEEMYPFAYWYHARGFNVLVPDLRCQGESDGDFIGMGWTDREDVMLWIGEILAADKEAKILLHGQSMGAACALMMSGNENMYESVKAVVADCPYTDAYSMFQSKIKDWFNLPAFPLVDSANIMLMIRGGYNLKKASAIEAVKHSKLPTLFIHGTKDAMIPYEMSLELYENETAPKELLLVEGAGHAQAQDKDPEGYYGAIDDFLKVYFD